MFVRMRWFTLGIVVSLSATVYVASRLRRARERFTVGSVSREAARAGAAVLDNLAVRVDPGRVRR